MANNSSRSEGGDTLYEGQGGSSVSGPKNIVSQTLEGAAKFFDADLYKSLPILALVGLVAIGFSGHLTFLSILEYIFFLIFLVILHNGLYLIKEKPFELWHKFQKVYKVVIQKIRDLRIVLYLVIFGVLFALAKLYFIANEEGLFKIF